MTAIRVQRGDTLGNIVARYNRQHGTHLTVAEVAKANGIADVNKIQAGGNIVIPDHFEQSAPRNQVIRDSQNRPMVRNGVREKVDVNAKDELIPVEPSQLDRSPIEPRQLLAPPPPPQHPDPALEAEARRQARALLDA